MCNISITLETKYARYSLHFPGPSLRSVEGSYPSWRRQNLFHPQFCNPPLPVNTFSSPLPYPHPPSHNPTPPHWYPQSVPSLPLHPQNCHTFNPKILHSIPPYQHLLTTLTLSLPLNIHNPTHPQAIHTQPFLFLFHTFRLTFPLLLNFYPMNPLAQPQDTPYLLTMLPQTLLSWHS